MPANTASADALRERYLRDRDRHRVSYPVRGSNPAAGSAATAGAATAREIVQGYQDEQELATMNRTIETNELTTQIAREAAKVALQTVDVADETSVELHRQQQVLEEVQDKQEQIKQDLKTADHAATFVQRKSCCWWIFACCGCYCDPHSQENMQNRKKQLKTRKEVEKQLKEERSRNLELKTAVVKQQTATATAPSAAAASGVAISANATAASTQAPGAAAAATAPPAAEYAPSNRDFDASAAASGAVNPFEEDVPGSKAGPELHEKQQPGSQEGSHRQQQQQQQQQSVAGSSSSQGQLSVEEAHRAELLGSTAVDVQQQQAAPQLPPSNIEAHIPEFLPEEDKAILRKQFKEQDEALDLISSAMSHLQTQANEWNAMLQSQLVMMEGIQAQQEDNQLRMAAVNKKTVKK